MKGTIDELTNEIAQLEATWKSLDRAVLSGQSCDRQSMQIPGSSCLTTPPRRSAQLREESPQLLNSEIEKRSCTELSRTEPEHVHCSHEMNTATNGTGANCAHYCF